MATLYEVQLGAFTLRYQLRRSRLTKHIRLLLYANGRCVVTGPARLTVRQATVVVRGYEEKIKAWVSDFPGGVQPSAKPPTARMWRADVPAARQLVLQKLAHWNKFYNAPYGQVRIKHMRTRWGSCSARKNLNFHVGIASLPEPLQDYLIVHELCHVLELNHSSRFWALVRQAIPDYQLRRRQLRAIMPA